jgi:hypothetical protein
MELLKLLLLHFSQMQQALHSHSIRAQMLLFLRNQNGSNSLIDLHPVIFKELLIFSTMCPSLRRRLIEPVGDSVAARVVLCRREGGALLWGALRGRHDGCRQPLPSPVQGGARGRSVCCSDGVGALDCAKGASHCSGDGRCGFVKALQQPALALPSVTAPVRIHSGPSGPSAQPGQWKL